LEEKKLKKLGQDHIMSHGKFSADFNETRSIMLHSQWEAECCKLKSVKSKEHGKRKSTSVESTAARDQCFHEGTPLEKKLHAVADLRNNEENEGGVSGPCLQQNLQFMVERFNEQSQRRRYIHMNRLSEEARSQHLSLDHNDHRSRRITIPGGRGEDRLRNTLARRTARSRPFKSAIFSEDSGFPDRDNLQEMNIQCVHCEALHFQAEKKSRSNEFDQCCNFGNGGDPFIFPVMRELFEGDTQECREFRANIRNYNNAFAMASLSAKVSLPRGPGPYCFRIHGQVYHTLHRLASSQQRPKSYAQLYFLDSEQACRERLAHPANRGCSRATMLRIQQGLNLVNPFIHSFKMMAEVIAE
uniref:Helitron_like_N domain-containing protein n=1 Tax=Heligmosomoides polygyrus TaxID=6339 RepID=A0A183G270_HELPZ